MNCLLESSFMYELLESLCKENTIIAGKTTYMYKVQQNNKKYAPFLRNKY